MDKQKIRQEIQERELSVSAQERSKCVEQILPAVMNCIKEQQPKVLLGYWPKEDEVDVLSILQVQLDFEGLLVFPRVQGDEIVLYRVDSLQVEHFEKHESWGFYEPLAKEENRVDPALVNFILVPGRAFDVQGGRLGRGLGFYDRLLVNCNNAYKLGVAFPYQMVDNVPMNEHDIGMDCVIWTS